MVGWIVFVGLICYVLGFVSCQMGMHDPHPTPYEPKSKRDDSWND